MTAATQSIEARSIPQTIGNFLRDNPIYVAIAGLVLMEKAARAGPWVGRVAGLALAGWGVWMLGTGR